jgi:oligosaccharide repeat unit polymerase
MQATPATKNNQLIGWGLTATGTFAVAANLVNIQTALASSAVICASYLLLRYATIRIFNFRRMTIMSFWYWTYLAMIFIPAFFVYADQIGPYRVTYLFAVESVLLTVPLGAFVASRLLHFGLHEEESFFRAPIVDCWIGPRFVRLYKLLLFLAFGLIALYLTEVKTVPLLYLIRNPGEYLQLALLREDALKLLDSHFTYAYVVLGGTLLPFLVLISLGCYLRTKQRRWRRMFFLSAFTGIFYASLTLAKSPVAAIFLMIAFFLYFYRGGTISRKVLASFLVLILAFPLFVVLGIYSGTDVGPLEAAGAIGTRMLVKPSEVVYYYFEVFPSHVGYLYGRSVGKLAWLLGSPYFDSPNYVGVYGFKGPEVVDSISANGAFIGNLNADFGIWGVLLGGVLAGMVLQASHIYLMRRRKDVPTLACYAFLVFAFWNLQNTALPVVLATDGVLLSLILRWMFESKLRPLRKPESALNHVPISAPQRG